MANTYYVCAKCLDDYLIATHGAYVTLADYEERQTEKCHSCEIAAVKYLVRAC